MISDAITTSILLAALSITKYHFWGLDFELAHYVLQNKGVQNDLFALLGHSIWKRRHTDKKKT